jgi:hypothetical protein
MTNDIDALMQRLTKEAMTNPDTPNLTDEEVDRVVAYQRAQRLGGKAEAAKAARKAQGQGLDIAAMMAKSLGPAPPPKPTQTIKRII